jgi:hypothetical protein
MGTVASKLINYIEDKLHSKMLTELELYFKI